jgi:hypothetical protein
MPPLENQQLLWREGKKIKAPNLRLLFEEGIISCPNSKALARDYRAAIEAIKVIAEKSGIELEDRIGYLGNWPNEDINAEI